MLGNVLEIVMICKLKLVLFGIEEVRLNVSLRMLLKQIVHRYYSECKNTGKNKTNIFNKFFLTCNLF